jgi:hypothetical protein
MAIFDDHTACPPGSHDFDAPPPNDPSGILRDDDQARDAAGKMLCNDCGVPLLYCSVSGWYYHTSPDYPDCHLSSYALL